MLVQKTSNFQVGHFPDLQQGLLRDIRQSLQLRLTYGNHKGFSVMQILTATETCEVFRHCERSVFMKTILLLGAAFTLSSSIAMAQATPTAPHPEQQSISTTSFWNLVVGSQAKVVNAACCKVCRKGKACGDSCINRSYTCRKGSGCACNG